MKKAYFIGLILICTSVAALTYYLINYNIDNKLSDYEIHNVSYVENDLEEETNTNYKVFKNYSEYKEFCNKYKLEEKLSNKDFNRLNYIMIYNKYTNKDDFKIDNLNIKDKSITIKASNKSDKEFITGTVIYLYSINKKYNESLNKINLTIDNIEEEKVSEDTINLTEEINNWLTDTKSDEYVVTVLAQTWCPHCNKYKPTINEVKNEYNFKLYWIDLDLLTKSDYNVIKNTYELSNYSGTPYTFVVKNGEFISFNVGNKSKEDLINYLEASNVIK